MELKDYLEIIKKRIWWLIVIVIITTVGTYWFTVSQPVTYDASSYVNILIKPENTQNYEYDNYYSLQAGSLFVDRVINWLQDPSNVTDIYADAQLSVPATNISNLTKIINAKKKAPATVTILINDKNSQTAQALVNSTKDFISKKTQELTDKGSIKNIDLDISKTLVSENKPNVMINTIIGFVSGIVLGLVMIFLAEYFARKK